jgi:hypothetical protein
VGCLKNVLAGVGCLVVLLAALVVGYVYRDDLAHLYRRVRGIPERSPLIYATPSAEAAQRAEVALAQLSRRDGPRYVELTADQLAALIDRELARGPSRVFDSIAVALADSQVLVKGSLDVSQLPRRLLGPWSGNLGRYEPVVARGRLAAAPDGRVLWSIEQLKLGDLALPRTVIPAIIRSLGAAEARDASVPIPLPVRVSDVRVNASGVRLYRAGPR